MSSAAAHFFVACPKAPLRSHANCMTRGIDRLRALFGNEDERPKKKNQRWRSPLSRSVSDRGQFMARLPQGVRGKLRTVSLQSFRRHVDEDVRHCPTQGKLQPQSGLAAGTAMRGRLAMGLGLCSVRESAMEPVESQDCSCGLSHALRRPAMRYKVVTIGSVPD